MAATFNSLESMGEEITDERLVSNNDIEEMLKVLKKQHPENEKFFEDCLDELKKNRFKRILVFINSEEVLNSDIFCHRI